MSTKKIPVNVSDILRFTSLDRPPELSELVSEEKFEGRCAKAKLPFYSSEVMPEYYTSHDGHMLGGESILRTYKNIFVQNGRTYGFGIVPDATPQVAYEPLDALQGGEIARLIAEEVVEGPTFLVSPHRAGHNYYHFMIDYLPSISFIKDAYAGRRPIMCAEHFTTFHHEAIELFFGQEFLLRPTPKGILLRDCTVPSAVNTVNAVDFLRSRTAHVPEEANGRRIYITRRNAGTQTRRVVNEEAVESLLKEFSFETIACEGMSLREQVALFKSAEIVCAPHGAGLTNIAFCRPGTPVIEFVMVERFPLGGVFWKISSVADLKYFALIGERVQNTYKSDDEGDFIVPLDKLRVTLEEAITNIVS